MHEKFQVWLQERSWFYQGFIEIASFPYGQLPSVDVDKHHDGCPSKVTPVPRFENRVFHLDLGPGQRSLTAEGKKKQFWMVIFMKTNACVCSVLGIMYKI